MTNQGRVGAYPLAVREPDPDLSVREVGCQIDGPALERSAQTRNDFGQDAHVLRSLGASVRRLELAFKNPCQDRRIGHRRTDRLVPWVVGASLHRTDVLIDS